MGFPRGGGAMMLVYGAAVLLMSASISADDAVHSPCGRRGERKSLFAIFSTVFVERYDGSKLDTFACGSGVRGGDHSSSCLQACLCCSVRLVVLRMDLFSSCTRLALLVSRMCLPTR